MQNRYIPSDEKLNQTIQKIAEECWVRTFTEAKLDAKQIEALGKAGLAEWEKALPQNKNFFYRLFTKDLDAQSIQLYENIKNHLSEIKGPLSLKRFYDLTQNLETPPSLDNERKNLIQFMTNELGKKIPSFIEQMEVNAAHVNESIKQFSEAYFLRNQNNIQQKFVDIIANPVKTEEDKLFVKITNSNRGYTAWERLDSYFNVNRSERETFFNDLITHLKGHFILCEETMNIRFRT